LGILSARRNERDGPAKVTITMDDGATCAEKEDEVDDDEWVDES